MAQPTPASRTTSPPGPSEREAPAVRLRGLTKRFGAVTAVDGVDLDIATGEFFSMLGPSGSGKTTVLRMVAGFETPTAGAVWLGGADVTTRPPFARDVNTVFQDYALFPHMSVRENVEYGLRVKKVGRADRRERAEQALATVRLAAYGERRPHELSGGQRQRVALARALVNRPSVLLLDEPLGALDLKLRREMQIELKGLQRDVGITFVFVTHDQEEALTMSDRIAVFNEGRVEQVASPIELYERPATAFVAGFVGTSNLLTGAVARRAVGEPGAVSIRPEKIHLHHGEAPADADDCRLDGTVVEVVYLGSATHSVVDVGDGTHLTVAQQNRESSIDHALAGCGSDSGDSGGGGGGTGAGAFTPPDLPMKKEMGDYEGQVNILAWPGYAEDGTNDPKVDWVSPFEKETGCQANVKVFATSDEAVSLMKTGEYDVVSASGDASLRLIASGDVEPVNTDLIPNYADVYPYLKDRDWNSVDGQMYGVPHGYGANLLMWRTDVVEPAPTSWGVVFEKDSPYAGKVTAYDSPIYIADAALYLMRTQPDLGIKNPYALDQDQLAAAVDLLKEQRANVGEYWADYLKEIQAFTTGDSVVGTTWQVIANVAQGEKVPVDVVLPDEGATGWSDTWMVGTQSKNKNCAYAWMNHIIGPEANAAVAEYFGEAPANPKACDVASPGHCETFHAGDADYASQIWYWTTPIAQCLDGRTDVTCTDYGDWTQAWTEVKG